MENPRSLETLEVKNPGDKPPNEASVSSALNEIFSGLASVSDISNDFGYESVELKTQVANDESPGYGSRHEELVELELEPEKVDEVLVETEAANDVSPGSGSQHEDSVQLEPEKVDKVLVETQAANDVSPGCGSRHEDSVQLEPEKVDEVLVETQAANNVSPGCGSRHEDLVELEPEKVDEVLDEAQAAKLEPEKVDEVCTETLAAIPQAEKVTVNKVCIDTQASKAEPEKIDETLTQVVKEENLPRDMDVSASQINENFTEEAQTFEAEKVKLEKVDAETEKVGPSEGISLYVDISGGSGTSMDDKDLSFSIGDIVWVRTRDISWWPGKILDPAGALAKQKTTGSGEGNLLVSCYGITHLAWCYPSQLRPFRESFAEMSVTSKAKTFLRAVQRAMDEFGRFEVSGRSEIGDFDPDGFLRRLRCLSVAGSMPCALDLAVTQSRLSSFYSSLGHKQVHIELLSGKKKRSEESEECTKSRESGRKIASGSPKRKATANEEGTKMKFDSRERKKSRYLSYPYVNFEQRGHSSTPARTNHSEITPQKDDAVEAINIGGKKFWKSWRSSFSATGATGEVVRNSAPAELLSGLCSTAINGLDPDENKGFSSIALFFSRYRVSTYRDEAPDDTCTQIATAGLNEGVVDVAETSDDQLIKNLIRKKKKNKQMQKKDDENGVIGETVSKEKNNMKTNNPGKVDDTPGGPPVLSPCDKPNQIEVKICSEENIVADCIETKPKTVLPDLNGSCNSIPNPTVFVNLPQVSPEPTGINSSLSEKDGMTTTVLPGQSLPKKRKKEKKVIEKELPDLNSENGVSLSPKPEKAHKKKKRTKEMPIALNYPRNQSFSGTAALVLTFTPGASVPNREDLVSAFAKFGELRESDTRVSTEPAVGSGSAQVVFTNSSDGAKAFQSLEKGGENNNLFGPGLVSYRLHQVPEMRPPPPPAPAVAPAVAAEVKPPPLDFIKQNLEMMTMMLEKSGEDLSKEMRAKLECEIKGLLGKVSSMSGSCSS